MLPNKRYSIIYADPPWDYEQAIVNPYHGLDTPSKAENHYSTMTTADIAALPVSEIAATDSLLFMWVVSPKLDECISVGLAWGFEYKTVAFVWDKVITNPGYYTMSQVELCLVFKKGKIPQPRGKRNIRQFVQCKRGSHSAKPLQVKSAIVEMFPYHDRIELFARPGLMQFMNDGWDYWGNEVNTND